MNKMVMIVRIFVAICFTVYLGKQVCYAQACAGKSLIDETFGTTKDSRLSLSQTPYQFVMNSCVSDGEYTIASTVDGRCHGAIWHEVSEDHTPNDANGNMLIINSNYQAGEFYSQSVSGLCKSASYEFSIWFLNIYNLAFTRDCIPSPLYPAVTVSIETEDGILIKSDEFSLVNSTNTPTWVRRAVSFTLPLEANTVKIRLTNTNLGGCGNDFALDDIQLVQCTACSSPKVYVPDVFTPNRDGINDFMLLFFSETAPFELRIYDRWGSAIFTSSSLTVTWDGTYLGKPCPEGVYPWEIAYQVANLTNQFQKYTKKGKILLLR